jgi:hypothetical protein
VDATALYVKKADEACLVGPGPVAGYLNPYRIVELALAHRSVRLRFADARPVRLAHQINVAAQTPSRHGAFHLARRGAVRVREHDALERQGDHEHTQQVRCARLAMRCDQIASRKADFTRLVPIHEHSGVGI